MHARWLVVLPLLVCAACSRHKQDSPQGGNAPTPGPSLVDPVTNLNPPPKTVSQTTIDAWGARGFWPTVTGFNANGLLEVRPHYMKVDDLTSVLTGFRPKQEAFATINDDKLKTLPNVEGLFALHLSSTKVTDAGMKELARQKYLRFLDLSGTPITDAGLKELTGLSYLTHLSLNGTRLTDAGVKSISSIKSLTSLNLSATRITEASIHDLATMPNLTFLYLNLIKLTDTGMKDLAAIKSLTVLSLQTSGVTETQVKELQQALPKCKIIK